MYRVLACAGAIVAVLSPLGVGAQTGGFLVRLGNDTVAIERYERAPDKITGAVLRHSPQANIVKYTIGLNKDGTVATYEQNVTRADGSPMPGQPPSQKMTFTGDSVVREVMANGQLTILRNAAPHGTLPAIGGSWLLQELEIQAGKRDGAAYVMGFGAQQTAPGKVEVHIIGPDSAEIVQVGFRTGFRLDRSGRVLRGDGSLSTQKFLATPLRNSDIAALASAWAAKDAAGQTMGAASTRDTVNADVAGAKIWIDYGRPAVRGRDIWGALVPFDTVWRMGANAAAQLRTDKDLVIGGTKVPAGFYTIWLLPSAGQSYLIINKQTGQWGTAYDAKQDLVRIPVDSHMGEPSSEERFHIFVKDDMLMMRWDRGGYGVKIKAG